MRRTIKQQPMSLQEISERKEQAEQRIHAADGLVASAEQYLGLLRAQVAGQENDLASATGKRTEADRELKASWDACAIAKEEKRKLEGEVAALEAKRDGLEADIAMAVATEALRRDDSLSAERAELAKLNEAKDKARAEFADICKVVEERKAKAQSLSEAARKLEVRREAIELEIASLEPKKEELARLNEVILDRKDAVLNISGEYSRVVGLVEKEKQALAEAKNATAGEQKRAEAIREQLSVEKADVMQLIAQERAIQENLEAMRTRMIRAEKDAAAKEFLNKGY